MNQDLPLFNRALLETLYGESLRDPTRLPESWRRYFASLTEKEIQGAPGPCLAFKLLLAYRTLGPLAADLNPLPWRRPPRLERFLQLCAEENLQICVPTTPAQMFHLLRRQQLRPYRKPLIVLTPKSLLRHKGAVSPLEALSKGSFEVVLDDTECPKERVRALVFCCGKIYYELLEARRRRQIQDLPLIRLEQLYPFPRKALTETIERYKGAKQFFWVQEEPQNQGAWFFVRERWMGLLPQGQRLIYIGRPAEAVPVESYLPPLPAAAARHRRVAL